MVDNEDEDETAEVEAALSIIDDELDQTEDALTQWSRGPTTSTSSHLRSPSSTNLTASSFSTTLSPSPSSTATTGLEAHSTTATNIDRDWRILSTISEHTENPSRPTSHSFSAATVTARPPSANLTPGDTTALRRSGGHLSGVGSPTPHMHSRSTTDLSMERDRPPPGRRAGDLIAFFEDRDRTATSPSLSTSYGHSRTTSAPSGPRSPSPYYTHSRSTPNLESTTGTGYGYTSTTGYTSRPSSVSSSGSGSGPISMSSLLSPPTRGGMTSSFSEGTSRVRSPISATTDTRTGTEYMSPSTYTNTFTNTFTHTSTPTNPSTTTGTGTITPTGSGPLRRPHPQTSPRSPLSSVRNIVAAWKERTPSLVKSGGGRRSPAGPAMSSTSAEEATNGHGLFSIRRRAERGSVRAAAAREGNGRRSSESMRERDSGGGRRSGEGIRERGGEGGRPTTPMSGISGTGSGLPPPFDAAELGAYARESREVSHFCPFWF